MVSSSDFRYLCFAIHLINSAIIASVIASIKRSQHRYELREDLYVKILQGLCFVLFLVGDVGFLFGQGTYLSYAFLNLLIVSSLAMFVSVHATVLLICLLNFADTSSAWKQVLLQAGGLALVIWVGWLLSVATAGSLASGVRALREGPLHVSGTVEAKKTSGWRWTTFHVSIDGVHYEVLDRAWWPKLHRGQRVDFLTDPDRTVAFEPGSATLTPLAIAATVSLGALWLVGGVLLLRWLHTFLPSP